MDKLSGGTAALSAVMIMSILQTSIESIQATPSSPVSSGPTTPPQNVSNISIFVSITASGSNTAGQTYRLVCSATVTGSIDQTTFTWLYNSSNITSDISRIDTGDGSYSSNLTFSPLAASHAGTYTCRVTARGETETQTNTTTVNGMEDFSAW